MTERRAYCEECGDWTGISDGKGIWCTRCEQQLAGVMLVPVDDRTAIEADRETRAEREGEK